jgi:hypothetical protein
MFFKYIALIYNIASDELMRKNEWAQSLDKVEKLGLNAC